VDVTLTPRPSSTEGQRHWDKALDTWSTRSSRLCVARQAGHQARRPGDDVLHRVRRHELPVPGRGADRRGAEGPPKGDIAVGQTPAARRSSSPTSGSFHSDGRHDLQRDPEYLDEKQLDASGTFIEEYQTDPVTTPEDKFDIQIYVLLK
jgi:hypothetical protein